MKQTVTVVETCTDDAHCDRFGSMKCETWTDVAQCTDMKVTGTDNSYYMTFLRSSVYAYDSLSTVSHLPSSQTIISTVITPTNGVKALQRTTLCLKKSSHL